MALGLRVGPCVFPHVENRRGKPLGADPLGQCPAGASISRTYLRARPTGCSLLVPASVMVRTEQGACVEGCVLGKILTGEASVPTSIENRDKNCMSLRGD